MLWTNLFLNQKLIGWYFIFMTYGKIQYSLFSLLPLTYMKPVVSDWPFWACVHPYYAFWTLTRRCFHRAIWNQGCRTPPGPGCFQNWFLSVCQVVHTFVHLVRKIIHQMIWNIFHNKCPIWFVDVAKNQSLFENMHKLQQQLYMEEFLIYL